jgi:hypothetical protein
MDRKSFSIRRIGEFAVLDRRLKRNRGFLARFIAYLPTRCDYSWTNSRPDRKSRRTACARIGMPDDRNFEAEGEAIVVLSTSSNRRKSCAIQKELTPEKI